jgi:ubiquinone/menaquinone biosynthesis C-methylase UbiE
MVATADITLPTVKAIIGKHLPLYNRRPPAYHTVLLKSMSTLWDPTHARVLDVGGGTGIIAQAMKDLFAIPEVTSIDVEHRFLGTLDIETHVYDGTILPFADGSFDCITFSNVMHHVPTSARSALMRECARVVGSGPIYIKDHLASSRLDHARLFVLDAVGNLPLHGMVKAKYLTAVDWEHLASDAGFRIDSQISGEYRAGAFQHLFPNRLETTMRLVRTS